MKRMDVDLAVIGAGPAGLAAAVEAKARGVNKVLVLERDDRPGGILNQCIHDGFGVLRWGKRLTGGQYAQAFVDLAREAGVEILTGTMALELTPEKQIYAVNETDGMLDIRAKAVVLAMGCRERSRPQAFIFGTRPAGVYTAGTVQRLINAEGYLPGKRAVILGSGDIGLIMARRMTLEGIEVEGVYELMKNPGGLTRNLVQCLEDYGIPLHLQTTVTAVHGRHRVEGVTVAQVDEARRPVEGTQRDIPCDMLVLSVGLIPENELSAAAGITLDPVTRGPVVDQAMMTNINGVFAAGNVAAVFDLVDYVSDTGELAARGAAAYLAGQTRRAPGLRLVAGDNIALALPQMIRNDGPPEDFKVFLRVKEPMENVKVCAEVNGKRRPLHTERAVKPAEMVVAVIPAGLLADAAETITLHAGGDSHEG